jgi:hypothetical protein
VGEWPRAAGGAAGGEGGLCGAQLGCTKFHLNHGSITQLMTVASVSRMTVKLCDQSVGQRVSGGGVTEPTSNLSALG